MEVEVVKAVAPIIGGLLSGLLGGLFVMRTKLKGIEETDKRDREKKKEEEKIKEEYLDPLRVAAQVFLDRLKHINKDYIEYQNTFFFDTLRQLEANYTDVLPEGVPYQLWKNDTERFKWANDYGNLVISTLRITSLYFYHANIVLEKLPYLELTPGNDDELRRYIIRVGKSLGGKYGIWEDLHDSLGKYMIKKDGNIMDYRDFCRNEILHKENYVWFSRMIEFYRDFPLKEEKERQEMIDSLRELCGYLKEKTDTLHQKRNKK